MTKWQACRFVLEALLRKAKEECGHAPAETHGAFVARYGSWGLDELCAAFEAALAVAYVALSVYASTQGCDVASVLEQLLAEADREPEADGG